MEGVTTVLDLKVAVIMTVHNRREKTLACLRSVAASRSPSVDYQVFIVDDGSTDGTSQAVQTEFPAASVIGADGDLYWAAGMALAESAAREHAWDVLLWLNDDVELIPDR